MQIKREVGEKGQVVIPKDVRDYLNIKPGSNVVFEVRKGEAIIRPEMTGRAFVEYFCKTSKKLKRPPSIREIKKLLDEQYEIP